MAGPSGLDSAVQVHCETRAEWRAWLSACDPAVRGVWLVSWKKPTGRPAVGYDDSVSEALAFGWVDSTARRLDDDRTMLYFARRRPRSGWSRPNKLRIEVLQRDGLMTLAGQQVIDAARADGSWTLLDEVEELIVPADLAQAFAAVAGSREHWDAFSRSARRGMLEWVVQAKREDTRARRLTEIAAAAGRGERAK